jgi:hypothetical protein
MSDEEKEEIEIKQGTLISGGIEIGEIHLPPELWDIILG